MSASGDIAARWKDAKAKGVDLGSPVGPEESAGYGGRVQRYQNGHIYWHPNTGAHEVHGGILKRYLAAGGPGVRPGGSTRDFGFPTSDESWSRDGRTRVSHFEWGAIFWRHGAREIWGAFHRAWTRRDAEIGPFGYPVVEFPVAVAGGHAMYFEHGIMWTGAASGNKVLRLLLGLPQLGQPALGALDGTGLERRPVLQTFFHQSVLQRLTAARPHFLEELFAGRFVARALPGTLGAPPDVPLTVAVKTSSPMPIVFPELIRELMFADDEFEAQATGVAARLGLAPGGRLRDRTLYDLWFRGPDGVEVNVAPHALYAKENWENFGLAHATDLHVSQRLEGFGAELSRLGREESAHAYNNFNDRVREFVRHANRLQRNGQLDVVLMTGDLVDFVFENGESRDGPGNFALFMDILCGKDAAFPGASAEPLRVPIFTCLGNHDYRANAYPPLFKLELLAGTSIHEMPQFAALNLTEEDAFALWTHMEPLPVGAPGWQPGKQWRVWPYYGASEASAFVALDRRMREGTHFYFRAINRQRSYIIPLGRHRIVMLDSGPDVGIVTSTAELFYNEQISADEDKSAFIGGGPNSEGLSAAEVALVRQARLEAGQDGIVIVGVHAPVLNIKSNEYGHFFRETEHAATEVQQFRAFARRHLPPGALMNNPGTEEFGIDRMFPDWILKGTPYFKRGTTAQLLDDGVCRGEVEDFFRECQGSAGSRPVDLVLFGHVHKHVEYRMDTEGGTGKHLWYHDHYFENPHEYYSSREFAGGRLWSSRVVRVFPQSDAAGGERAIPFTDHSAKLAAELRLNVPVNPHTLEDSTNQREWWAQHRPLLVQTAPLGPIDSNQRRSYEDEDARRKDEATRPNATFQGYRLITVEGGVMTHVRAVRMAELHAKGRMPWETPPVRPVGESVEIGVGDLISR